MKRTTTISAIIALGFVMGLGGCNTIKGMLGGDEEAPKTESEPGLEEAANALDTEAPAVDTAAPEATASAAPSASATAEVAEIQTANEAEIKRFDDEQKLEEPEDTKLKDQVTNVIKEPPGGDLVAVLQPGTEVKALAEHEEFMLIAFDNPEKPGELLMGWTKTEAVEPVAAASASATTDAPPDCVPGLSQVFVGATQRCELACTSNAGCPTGKKCIGSGKLSTNGAPGAAVKFCVTAQAAAPTPQPPRNTEPPRNDPPKDPPPTKKKKKKKKKKAD